MSLTVGSLFSGIGGLELGLERAGMQTAWQVEKDDYCRRVLAKHWPNIPRYDDVCTVGAHNLLPVDVICGGFPCQDISTAGRGAGITEGTRSGLWFQYRRIIRELRPRYVVVENVAALLSRGLGIVLGDLAESGYDAEWDCIPAAAVGAPHRRDRLFLVAYASGQHGELRRESGNIHGSVSPTQGGGQGAAWKNSLSARNVGAHAPDTNRERKLQSEGRLADFRGWPRDGSWWSVEPDVGRVAYGVPDAVDRISALGNAVVPQVAEYIGRLIVAHDERTAVVALSPPSRSPPLARRRQGSDSKRRTGASRPRRGSR